jgi:Astacin (Peptidase family M12A)
MAVRRAPPRLSAIAIAVAIVGLARGQAQSSIDRAGSTELPPPQYVVIDDQVFDLAGQTLAGAEGRFRPQGATLDNDSVTWVGKFNGWEAGIIPIEFASDVSQAHRDQFMRVCNSGWGSAASVACIPRTSQNGYLRVTEAAAEMANAAPCFSIIGQPRRLVRYEIHLGPTCWADSTVYHEQGHALGFIHEHQRPDRDSYVSIDLNNVPMELRGNFTRVASLVDQQGAYDFLSIMHYRFNSFAADTTKPTIVPIAGWGSYATSMGTSTAPTALDREAVYDLYSNYFRPIPAVPFGPTTTRFDRTDFLDAMERLDAFYYSRLGLNRPNGLSINGRPDFLGIATWIFDVYLGARSRGLSPDVSFGILVVDISQSQEWKDKHPGWTSGTRGGFTPAVSFDRSEFLQVLQQLDAFYSAPEGLQRPNGLSINGGPDFLGIATWVFDIYLSERLSGASPSVAWLRVVTAIQGTQEWRSKHP